jgi:hypothetical protein
VVDKAVAAVAETDRRDTGGGADAAPLTYGDVKASPSGWEDLKMKDFELALSELIDTYRNKTDKAQVVAALEAQGQQVTDDESWTESEPSEDDEDDDDDKD